MDCKENLEPQVLIARLRSDDSGIINRVLWCLDDLFKSDFTKNGFGFLKNWNAPLHEKEEMIEVGFNNTLLKLNEMVGSDRFYLQEGITVTKFFRSLFYKALDWKLKDRFKQNKNRQASSFDPDEVINRLGESGKLFNMENKSYEESDNYELFKKALSLMDEMERNLIIWRKLEGYTSTEIAELSGYPANVINDHVYNAVIRLKGIINRLKGGGK